MRSGEDGDVEPYEPFAGDLVLRLATEGWLVMSAEQAQGAVDDLEWTLAEIRSRLRKAELSRRLREMSGENVSPDVDCLVIRSAFAGQIAAERWERALVELPKYIQAFRIAGSL
ncbi:hypothetical protein [Actinophytocola xanthii]|uniref:Uncharacterized protein n=1 Tax=Actinophytocola xanthii TaxID=1912961 RepID=A0A1Q8CTB5_9PSEU|nr:hypothetical protein [Actinophytocola xanthii]OLF17596.1 hypothetical protein BU204_10280 [Actinophytocola xanthii]